MPDLVDAASAIKKIPKGKRIFLGSGAAFPTALTKAMAQHSAHFSDHVANCSTNIEDDVIHSSFKL